MSNTCIHWFRRDLRLADNAALYRALTSGMQVIPVFIFDTNILDELKNRADRRVQFIHDAISEIANQLKELGCELQVYCGKPHEQWAQILQEHEPSAIFYNKDYEPYAITRDQQIETIAAAYNCSLYGFKDHVVFEEKEITKDDNTPYTVYTPYSKKWKARLNNFYIKPYPTEKYFSAFAKNLKHCIIPSLAAMNFLPTRIELLDKKESAKIILDYHHTRDIPSIAGTTKVGIQLRFGTISIRGLAAYAAQKNEKYLNELIWRDFYQQILWHFPHVVNGSFRSAYDAIVWRNNEEEFAAWCSGNTGYPIVDAGMRELNTTGWMHNRVRMIVASFLTKHLLIDWRWGEAYFAEKLNDFDLASNNGGWQWAAGSGVDAAPYFRIFNPYLQTERFDAQRAYIKKWIPEIDTSDYPQPIVQHELARARCLETYKAALK